MEEPGRAGMPSSALLAGAGYGRRVGLRLPAADAEAVRRRLPHWWADTSSQPERTWELASARQADYVLRELELWVAEHAVDRIFVHAGVVGRFSSVHSPPHHRNGMASTPGRCSWRARS